MPWSVSVGVAAVDVYVNVVSVVTVFFGAVRMTLPLSNCSVKPLSAEIINPVWVGGTAVSFVVLSPPQAASNEIVKKTDSWIKKRNVTSLPIYRLTLDYCISIEDGEVAFRKKIPTAGAVGKRIIAFQQSLLALLQECVLVCEAHADLQHRAST